MAKPYSDDLRRRVVETVEDGATIPEAAERLGVSISSVVRFLRRRRETGSVKPSKFGGYKPYSLSPYEKRIRRLVREQPDITLAELQARLTKEKVSVAQSSVFRFLRHLGLTFKKKPARGRAGSAGRRGRAPGLAKAPAAARSKTACVHR